MSKVRSWIFLPAAAALLAAGCGYNLVGQGGKLPGDVTRVAVPMFTNQTKDTQIARIMTNDLIRALLAMGRVEVVPPEEAQAEIRGVVTRYEVERISFDTDRNVTENRLVVTVDVGLYLKGETEPHFQEKGVHGYREYSVEGDLTVERKEEDASRQLVATDISQKVISLMTGGF